MLPPKMEKGWTFSCKNYNNNVNNIYVDTVLVWRVQFYSNYLFRSVEYHPLLFRQHEGVPHVEMESFNKVHSISMIVV